MGVPTQIWETAVVRILQKKDIEWIDRHVMQRMEEVCSSLMYEGILLHCDVVQQIIEYLPHKGVHNKITKFSIVRCRITGVTNNRNTSFGIAAICFLASPGARRIMLCG